MSFPKVLAKISKHRPPRYMLYQPGFNNGNSCWLKGRWVNVSPEEWEERKDLYVGIREWSKDQHYKDKGTALKRMTPAQKRAYEFYSGDETFDCFNKRGYHCTIRVYMGGKSINDKSVAWMREKGYKIIALITFYGKISNQLKGLKGVPEDLVLRSKKPVDTEKKSVKQDRYKQAIYFDTMLETDGDIYLTMEGLNVVEENIIKAEWYRKHEKCYNDNSDYDNSDYDIKEYVRRRKLLKNKLLPKEFDEIYTKCWELHNECARANLKNNYFSFILPVFYDDGTHEPWSDKDAPVPGKSHRC